MIDNSFLKILAAVFILLVACKQQNESSPQDFIFIELGPPENSDSLKKSFGSRIYIQSLFKEDSLLIKTSFDDSIKIYKIHIPNYVKQAYKDFRKYSIGLNIWYSAKFYLWGYGCYLLWRSLYSFIS